jgi:hypothetical protein
VATALLTLLASGCGNSHNATAVEGGWVRIEPEGAGFSIEFPAAPGDDETLGNDGQPMILGGRRIVLDQGERKAQFRIEYLDYDENLITTLTQATDGVPQKLVDAGTMKLTTDLGGSVTRSKPTSLGDHPGSEVEVRFEDGGSAQAHVYLVGTRLYRLVVSRPLRSPLLSEVKRFLGSFALHDADTSG